MASNWPWDLQENIMALKKRAKFEDIKTLGFASITGAGYTLIGFPSSYPSSNLLIQNLTDATLAFSDDGISVKFKLPKLSAWNIDVTANKTDTQGFYFPELISLYVKSDTVDPTLGEVCVSSIYGG